MARKMTFGYVHDFRNPAQWRRPWADVYAETLDFVVACEELGFQSAWFAEHHVSDDGYLPSPLSAVAALATRTNRIKLGTAISLAPFYHPVRFAEDTAIIDVMANGRLELGMAIGYRRRETDAYGIDFRRRAGQMNEFLELVRRLWSGETVTFEGRHFQIKSAFLAPPPPRGNIPLYIGGFSDKAIERAAKYGDGYFGNPELCDLYREKLRAIGKEPAASRILVQDVFLVVARDPEKALNELAPHFHYVNQIYGEWLSEDGYGEKLQVDDYPQGMSLEEFKNKGMLRVLSPAQAIEMFNRLDPQIEHLMMMVPPGMRPGRFLEYADTFAKDVLPAFGG